MPKLLLIPLLAAGICQAIKLVIIGIRTRRIPWKAIDAYGGMPSTHTAMVVSLVTVLGFDENFDSALFAIAIIFSLIIIRDAIGFRRYLGWHSEALNHLIRYETPERQKVFRQYSEQVGHTPLQAFVGALIGFIASWILFRLLP